MKTRELVRRLLEIDPDGETEVSVGGEDIFFLQQLPGYYDGRYEVLLRDPSKEPYYDVVGVRICREGYKINIHTHSSRDFLLDFPDGLIEYDSKSTQKLCEKEIEEIRQEYRELNTEIEEELKNGK